MMPRMWDVLAGCTRGGRGRGLAQAGSLPVQGMAGALIWGSSAGAGLSSIFFPFDFDNTNMFCEGESVMVSSDTVG